MANAYERGISTHEFKKGFKDDILSVIEIRNALQQKQTQKIEAHRLLGQI